MANNLITGCHKCRVRQFHFVGEEHLTMRPFYLIHMNCINESIQNVVTVMDNIENTPRWCDSDDPSLLYKEVSLTWKDVYRHGNSIHP